MRDKTRIRKSKTRSDNIKECARESEDKGEHKINIRKQRMEQNKNTKDKNNKKKKNEKKTKKKKNKKTGKDKTKKGKRQKQTL